MTRLESLDAKANLAMQKLAAEINRQFPVGSQVFCEWGRGFTCGTVVHETRGREVIFRSVKGNVHHRWYRMIERAS